MAAAWQGKGIGDELMRRLLDRADNWAGYLKIELTVYVDNARAIALYRKYGFARKERAARTRCATASTSTRC